MLDHGGGGRFFHDKGRNQSICLDHSNGRIVPFLFGILRSRKGMCYRCGVLGFNFFSVRPRVGELLLLQQAFQLKSLLLMLSRSLRCMFAFQVEELILMLELGDSSSIGDDFFSVL